MPIYLPIMPASRHATIDLLRATAIVLMLVFHFIYDLNFLSLANIDMTNGTGWQALRAVIVTLFLITMGASLKLAFPLKISWRSLLVKLVTLATCALLISLTSLFLVNENWIFFGIIHFILLASILAVGLRHLPKLSLMLAIIILVIDQLSLFIHRWPFHYIQSSLPLKTNDFVAIFPWLAVPFLGIWLINQPFIKNDPCRTLNLPKAVQWLSRHALVIYMMHQPIFLGVCYGYKYYFSP